MNKLIHNPISKIVLHGAIWLVLFCFPYLFSFGQNFKINMFIEHTLIPLGLSAVLFYINYYRLIDQLFFQRKRTIYFLANALVIALFVGVRYFARVYMFEGGEGPKEKPPVAFFLYFDALSFLIPLVIAIAFKLFERWLTTEAERKESENSRLESELEHLKYQLQPHFFFNSLNNIYALVDLAPERAKMTILALSTLMRYLLYESNTEKVSLQKEVEFLQKYIELMELRSSSNTTVITHFDEVAKKQQIAPLLLIPLIENAFKHGISASQENRIEITLKCTQHFLFFETRNGNHPKNEIDRSGSGIGLKNVRKRLELIYPNAYSFDANKEGDLFVTRLELHKLA